MPRVVVSEKYPVNPNKIMTRAAAAAAAASSTANSSTEDLSTRSERPSTSASEECTGTAASSTTSTSKNQCPPRPDPASSPAKCAICLENLSNRCYTNSCIHQFCFGCLLEWSKIKAECPLCKSNFQSIYHNIRNNDDYDEYHIPQTANIVPHLSIRLTAEGFRAQLPTFRFDEPLPAHALQVGVLSHPPSPFHDHGYSFQRLVRERERERRQLLQNNSYIRILEMGPFSEPRAALDFVNYSGRSSTSRSVLDNPFYTDEPELFGVVDDNANRVENDTSLRGYQSRKRIYDRAQFVQPFAATLPAGTVFFPSVEYFQTHPSALSRVSTWLYREIMVLMGLHRSRNEMGYVYDLILSILPRYDIRSRDFRETVTCHFGVRTRHFQHEFYHFLISGMLLEEYDRVAQYTNPSSNNTSTATNDSMSTGLTGSNRNTRTTTTAPSFTSTSTTTTGTGGTSTQPQSPLVVTLDSSDSSESESDASSVETLNYPRTDANSNNSLEILDILRGFLPSENQSSSETVTRAEARRDRLVPQSPVRLSTVPSPTMASPPSCRVSSHQAPPFRPTREVESAESTRHGFERLPTDFAVPSSPSGRRCPWTPSRQPPVAHSHATTTSPFGFEVARPAEDWASTLESLNRFRPGQTNSSRRHGRLNYYPQPIDGHRYASSTEDSSLLGVSGVPPTTATRNDLERPRCPVETGYPVWDDTFTPRPERQSSTGRRQHPLPYIYGQSGLIHLDPRNRSIPGTPGYVRRVSSHADPVTNINPDGTPRRSTVAYPYQSSSPGTSSSASISSSRHIIQEALKGFAKAGQSSDTSSRSAPAPPASSTVQSDDDEIEMLGIHPVVKPPPLAIITLSSDDEEGKPKLSNAKVETSDSTTTGPTGASTSTTPLDSERQSLPTTAATVTVEDAETESDGVIFDAEHRSSVRIRSPTAAARSDAYGSSKNRESSKHRKHKSKKIKYITPEYVDKTGSSSTESEDEIYVESVGDNKMKLKRKKGNKMHHQKSNSSREGSREKSRERSREKKKKRHRHSHGHGRDETFGDKLEELRRKTDLAHRILTKAEFLAKSNRRYQVSSTSSDSDVDSDWAPSLPRRTIRQEDLSRQDYERQPMKRDLSSPKVLTPTSLSGWTSSVSVTAAAAATMPSTTPGIGILDLRKLIEEKKQHKRDGDSSMKMARSSSTLIAPSHGNGMNMPRWESEASDAERPIDVNDNVNSTGSESDWTPKPMWSGMKRRAVLVSDSSEEEENVNDNEEEDSSSSDTQCNSRETHRNGSGNGRGSFFIPNHPESTHRVSLSPPRTPSEIGLTRNGGSTTGETLDLRVTDASGLLNPWRDDPIIGGFVVPGVGDDTELLDLSMQEPSPIDFLEGDWAQGEGSSRRPSIEDNSDNGSRSYPPDPADYYLTHLPDWSSGN